MGTETKYAVDVLEAYRNSERLPVQCRVFDRRTNVNVNKCSANGLVDDMDRMLVNYNVDSIKKTMKMHEDVFKHQVRELHRLYSVQKRLMDDLTKELKRRNNRSDITNSKLINWTQPATIRLSSRTADTYPEGSASCSGDAMRMSMGFDLERPAEEVISSGIVALCTEDQRNQISNPVIKNTSKTMKSIVPEEDSYVELTLSIGSGSLSKTRTESNRINIEEIDSSANSFKSDRGGGESDPNTPMSSSSATVDQERKRPHWLFNGLKLK